MSKILGSKFEDYINAELLGGTSSRALSEKLKESGFSISHNALSQYHNKELGGEVKTVKADQKTPTITPIEPNSKENTAIMQQSFRNALVIANQRLVEHSEGECKFPTEELKGLKLLDDIMKSNEVVRK